MDKKSEMTAGAGKSDKQQNFNIQFKYVKVDLIS